MASVRLRDHHVFIIPFPPPNIIVQSNFFFPTNGRTRIIPAALALFFTTLFPYTATGTPSIMTVAAGGAHALALADNGTVWAWGFNDQGQLGDGSLQFTTSPVQVHGLPEIKSISAGFTNSMALGRDGSVWTWGSNQSGELGNGTTIARSRPEKIKDLDHITAIALNAGIGMAVKDDGSLWLWGKNNRLNPIQMSTLRNVVGIGVGQSSLFAYTFDCVLWAWGKNSFGQLGDGTTTPQLKPVRSNLIACLSGVTASNHTLALSSTGEIWSWGYNRDGQLGNATNLNSSTPTIISGLNNIVAVSCDQHSLALQADGSVWAWGQNDSGQLGIGTTLARNHPVKVEGLRAVTGIAAGAMFSLATKADGSVWAWGLNNYGQLGDGSLDNHHTPTQVTGFEGFGLLNLKQPTAGPTKTLSPENIPPISFTVTPTSGIAPLTVTFRAVLDGGPSPVTIQWDFGDGEVANTLNPQHTYQSPGDYIATLNVTYKQEIFRESMKQIHVKAPR